MTLKGLACAHLECSVCLWKIVLRSCLKMEDDGNASSEGGALNFLLVLATSMFVGSYAAGSVPLLVNLSEVCAFSIPTSQSRMRMVTVFGAGLLIGTALAVIIPEGVESLYSAQSGSILVIHIFGVQHIQLLRRIYNYIHSNKQRRSIFWRRTTRTKLKFLVSYLKGRSSTKGATRFCRATF